MTKGQLLVVQQVTVSLHHSGSWECDKAKMGFAILYIMPPDARQTAERVAHEYHPPLSCAVVLGDPGASRRCRSPALWAPEQMRRSGAPRLRSSTRPG